MWSTHADISVVDQHAESWQDLGKERNDRWDLYVEKRTTKKKNQQGSMWLTPVNH